jgi:type II secretory pathway pseudopilin PulG
VSIWGMPTKESRRSNESGFSMVELAVVTLIIFTIAAMAVLQLVPSLQTARSDNAMRMVMSQFRQAREYSIDNRRYEQISFATVGGLAQIVITQKNSLTPGAGADAVMSTVYVSLPMQYALVSGMPNTPDGFSNSSAISYEIEGTTTHPTGNEYFQSDGELIDSVTNSPIDGTIFLGVAGNKASARAVTIMGSTGRLRGWKSMGGGATPAAAWVQF